MRNGTAVPIRIGYALASAILGIATAIAIVLAVALAGRCGPGVAELGTAEAVLFLFPVPLGIGIICAIVGYRLRTKAVASLGGLFILAVAAIGIIQVIPHYDNPDRPQCQVAV